MTCFTLSFTMPGCLVFHNAGEGDFIRTSIGSSNDGAKAEAAFQKGLKHYQAEQLVLAEESFARAVQLDPSHGRAHNNLGLLLFDQRQLALAATQFNLATEFLPSDPKPVNNLGMTLEAGGRVSEAIELYQRAHMMAPNNPSYLGNLVRLRVRSGQEDDLVRQELLQLAMIENRPDWVRWVQDQLSLEFNPMLDRGGNSVQLTGNREPNPNADLADESYPIGGGPTFGQVPYWDGYPIEESVPTEQIIMDSEMMSQQIVVPEAGYLNQPMKGLPEPVVIPTPSE